MPPPDTAGGPFDIDDLDRLESQITGLVRDAGRRALQWYRRPMRVDSKRTDGFDPVTAADRAVEDQLRAGLGRLFPGHAILGEERGETGAGPYRWVIDPIDGTRAFICGQPMWGTLVGFEVERQPLAGWMHQPVLDETHVATPAGGRLLRGGGSQPLAASTVSDLADAILVCTHPSMFAAGAEHDGFARLDASVRMTRYSGDCVNYGLLAAGHVDLVVENGLASYDIVPLIPIIEASGAVVTDLVGNLPLDGGYVVAAATAELHAAALDVLGSS